MFLHGPDASAAPEHPERISSFIRSTYRHLPLLQGKGLTPYTPTGVTFIDTLPSAGNCALGGCGDAHSEYVSECAGQCGCETPGCGDGFPAAAHRDPQLAFSTTDCTVKGEADRDWLAYHNCHPSIAR